MEHAILHLIYSRFWTKVMRDLGLVGNDEPATRLFTQGMVISNGAKMSKSKGNVVSPDDMIARYGADATRMYSLFAAPPDRDLDWQEDGVAGVSRFLGRVYRLGMRYSDAAARVTAGSAPAAPDSPLAQALLRKLHQTIRKITQDFAGRWHFNTCIAAVMELVNEIAAAEARTGGDAGRVFGRAHGHHLARTDPVAGALRALSCGRTVERDRRRRLTSCATRGRASIRTWPRKRSLRFRCR